MAYSKEENAIVERANKEVMKHLRAIVFHTKIRSKWNTYLPFVQRIMNSHVHESTGMSPQQLLMPSLKMDQRIFVAHPELTRNSVSAYAKELAQLQEIAIAVAQETQSARDSVNIRKRTHGETTMFPVNSFVLKAYPYTKTAFRIKRTLKSCKDQRAAVHIT